MNQWQEEDSETKLMVWSSLREGLCIEIHKDGSPHWVRFTVDTPEIAQAISAKLLEEAKTYFEHKD